MIGHCKECRYGNHAGGVSIECRRRAPLPHPSGDYAKFPSTHPDGWCGDFEVSQSFERPVTRMGFVDRARLERLKAAGVVLKVGWRGDDITESMEWYTDALGPPRAMVGGLLREGVSVRVYIDEADWWVG